MIRRQKIILYTALMSLMISCSQSEKAVLIEAENFDFKGGWVVDQQFMDLMGSPYLMAHGLGVPVADAFTVTEFPSTGKYNVFARTYNWTSPWHDGEGPGRFAISVNGVKTTKIPGSKGTGWMWQYAGKVKIKDRQVKVGLHDLTGFNGRVDAVYFTRNNTPPPDDIKELGRFRKVILKIPETPKNAGTFDLVVAGGGIAGTAASITAARLGLKVALIQDRPVLGGNNSSEVRVHLGGRINLEPYPALGDVVKEIGPSRGGNAQPADFYEDEKKLKVVLAEKNISLFTSYRVYDLSMKGSVISNVCARHIETGEEISFSAPLFADCTGDGTVGFLAGADYRIGREGKDEYGEPDAPEKADKMTMGSSVQWYSVQDSIPSGFPEFSYGIEFNEKNSRKVTRGEWTWETGMNLDQVTDFERIRDYGLLVVYSNWSFLKNHSQKKADYAKYRLEWVAYIAGKRESRRLLGDHILTENDITGYVIYPDASVTASWSIDLHYPSPENTKLFPDKEFISIAVQKNIYPYPIPYRCLYSRNIENLFMAGRNISVTHAALGTVRVMRTTGMMGEVVGMAASVAHRHSTTPREVYRNHLDELKALMKNGAGRFGTENMQNYNLGGTLGPRK